MYYIISIIIILINLFLLVSLWSLSEPKQKGNRNLKNAIKKETTEKKMKKIRILSLVNFIYAISGIILTLINSIVLSSGLKSSGLSEEFISWADDMYFGYAKGIFIFCMIIIMLTTVSFFLNKRFSPIRTIVVLTSSILVLIAGFLYSYIASNDTVSLSAYIQIVSIGAAIYISAPFTYEFLAVSEPTFKNRSKKTKENN